MWVFALDIISYGFSSIVSIVLASFWFGREMPTPLRVEEWLLFAPGAMFTLAFLGVARPIGWKLQGFAAMPVVALFVWVTFQVLFPLDDWSADAAFPFLAALIAWRTSVFAFWCARRQERRRAFKGSEKVDP